MKREVFNEEQTPTKQNRDHFIVDLREAVFAHRNKISESEKNDLDARILCLIEDLNYL